MPAPYQHMTIAIAEAQHTPLVLIIAQDAAVDPAIVLLYRAMIVPLDCLCFSRCTTILRVGTHQCSLLSLLLPLMLPSSALHSRCIA